MAILGIWDGHDSGCALIERGRVVAAINEERLTRRKLEIVFPARSIADCLRIARRTPADVEIVAASTTDPAKTLGRWYPASKERYYQTRRRKTPPGKLATVTKRAKYWITEWAPNGLTRRLSAIALRRELSRVGLGGARVALFDHHECHAASAAYASGFERAAVITIDGVGDGISSTISRFERGRLTRVVASPAAASLGIFFEHVTNLLNMRELEDEGKVMALADYAAPVPDEENLLLTMIRVQDGRVSTVCPGHAMMARLRAVQWRYPNEQFAYMAQRTVEEVCVQLARDAVALTGCRQVALAGGVASNVKANRRIRLLPDVESVSVFPHMGDGGLALGAAMAAAALVAPDAYDLSDLALGSEWDEETIGRALGAARLSASRPSSLADHVADLIARGAIVLWFQGRMEYGPRALGCRSVLARPDRIDIRDRLNLALKQRVWYQPFCPSLLESDAAHILADYDGRPNRHMTMAYVVKPECRAAMAGVTSVDGSCRPQMIADDARGAFPDLLRAVKSRLGRGIVLNTSFNIHGEALVCSPDEAIDVYRRSGADALAIGPFLTSVL